MSSAAKVPDIRISTARTDAAWTFDISLEGEDWTARAITVDAARQNLTGNTDDPTCVWSVSTADFVDPPTADTAVRIRIPASFWTDNEVIPGRYTIEVRGTDDEGPQGLAVFNLRLEPGVSDVDGHAGPAVGDGEVSSGGVIINRQGGLAVIRAGGRKGDQGPPGEAGRAPRKASGAISGHRAVVDLGGGLIGYPDLEANHDAELLLGVTMNAAADGGDIVVATTSQTISEPSWAWTPGLPIFCGAAGMLTQSLPAGKWRRQVATALSATEIAVVERPPIYLAT